MISFYPGPSRVYDEVPAYVKAAHRKGILSMNHRSEDFTALAEKTVRLLKDKLDIPENYSVYFATSATECWEMIAQSLVVNESIHIFNGAFGKKWFEYTKKIRPSAQEISFERETLLDAENLVFNSGEVICLTQNETSNGTQVTSEIISTIKKKNPQHLIAVDATSSMGGISLDFKAADIWFASVQKCFGLPAGLALMVCSPKAISAIQANGEQNHYNSLLIVKEMMDKWQTTCTPNVLGIYLLMRVMKNVKPIGLVDAKVRSRHQAWTKLVNEVKGLAPLVKNEAVRSLTVLTIAGNEKEIEALKKLARKKGFLLGEGYGDLKKSTFRIANFPAIKRKEIQKLMKFFLRSL